MSKLNLFGLHFPDKSKNSIKNEADFLYIVSFDEEIRGSITINDVEFCVHLCTGNQHWYIDTDDDVITVMGIPTGRIIAKFKSIPNTELNEMFPEVWKKVE